MSKLAEVCSLIHESVKTRAIAKDAYVSTENMMPNREGIIFSSNIPDVETVQSYRQDDILVSNIRPYFKKIWHADRDGGCSNDVLVFRANEGILPDYLYYALATDDFFAYATATAKGTKMPRGDKKAIMQYQIPNHTISEQQKIASILKKLDRKKSVNCRINDNLRKQVNILFKKNFVNLKKIPAGWEKGSLLDIADYVNGLAMQKYRPKETEQGIPVLKIKELRQGFCDINSEQCSENIASDYVVQDGDVIFSWSGSLLVDLWCGGICGLNQHLFKVSSNAYEKWFYYLWTIYYLNKFIAIAADKATTMGHIKRDELAKAEVLIPTKEDYDKMGDLMNPMFDFIIANQIESRKLANLRNELLPKLISGEINVFNIQI